MCLFFSVDKSEPDFSEDAAAAPAIDDPSEEHPEIDVDDDRGIARVNDRDTEADSLREALTGSFIVVSDVIS